MTELLTLKEAADRLRVSVRTVHRLLAAGNLRGLHVGRRHLVTVGELEAYIAWAQRRDR